MPTRIFLALLFGVLLTVATVCPGEPPNVVVIFIDDMGYADIGPFGCEAYATPNLDQMASAGRIFTDFHAATAVCSASRAALLTGCYPERVSVLGALGPNSPVGLDPDEVTIAELCKSRGYATACFGKWHLGDQPKFLPTRQGFDEYYGLPYSNDMWPYPDGEDTLENGVKRGGAEPYPPLPLYEGEHIVNKNVTPRDQKQLTTQYTEHAVDFIDRHAGKQPFFLYVPHSMVHVPLYVSDKFAGKSGAGLFGDVVMEIDWSVGQILAALERGGVADDTLVIFTSDNGPWLNFGDHAGSAAPLREGKGTMWEGGYREPCVMRWPGRIPAGTVCDELCLTMDLLPTIARLIGAAPPERAIDGRDILPLMTGDAPTPHEVFYCYYFGELRAVRDGRWKLTLPHRYRTLAGRPGGAGGKPVAYRQAEVGVELFDLDADIGETTDVATEHPGVVSRLLAYAEQARGDLGDRLTGRKGTGVRPAGKAPTR
ncbi:Arylsulfatase [Botrimarina colliarenosi]|uniref:Arylsulfatase n=1 Tax=Botrimarina colliarenosi TaxID=2528001 RepID=A0A5C6ABF4_9BACT|nr:sulfatase [Botrimarina colliarenosi]TWT96618.1 Arylsulfatase [Botrimarina colliarenosi]